MFPGNFAGLVVLSGDYPRVGVHDARARTSTLLIRSEGTRVRFFFFPKRANYLPDDCASRNRAGGPRDGALSRVGYCNAAFASLSRSFSLRSPDSLAPLTGRPPPPTASPGHHRSCTSILRDSPFSIYFTRLAPRFSLQMSPRGRLTFALPSSPLRFFFAPSISGRPFHGRLIGASS